MVMVTQANARSDQPLSHWRRLATVARERASEQSGKAAAAADTAIAKPHLEQQAYLVRLAETYEQRAKGGT